MGIFTSDDEKQRRDMERRQRQEEFERRQAREDAEQKEKIKVQKEWDQYQRKMNSRWEYIGMWSYRLRVLGGWLVVSQDSNGYSGGVAVASIFIADPYEEWRLDSDDSPEEDNK